MTLLGLMHMTELGVSTFKYALLLMVQVINMMMNVRNRR